MIFDLNFYSIPERFDPYAVGFPTSRVTTDIPLNPPSKGDFFRQLSPPLKGDLGGCCVRELIRDRSFARGLNLK